jgi:AraC family transcriptional regulator of adaptative response/methylated-DNA-[protein]-cysteine methyltransferase
MQVSQFLLSLRDGNVLSYSELAAAIDKPKAVRAVASACGKNRIGVLIPCHRVLRSDFGMGGYRWGLERKRALLDKEKLSVAPTQYNNTHTQ